jgi:hypothetical protein
MSLRMPQSLSSSPRFETGLSVLEAELAGEKATVLGRLGREVEASLERLAAAGRDSPTHPALMAEASDALWRYLVQREVCGMLDHAEALKHYGVPPAVAAGVGAVRRAER